ncbi:MAG TPA: hypothetical protein VFE25_02895 [Opitutaceae bacterium]|jgi:hypothetical protein|nr:hypothetical protein [Opitutaceae bacterium]
MKARRHFSSVWIAFVLGAGAILIWKTTARISRLGYLSSIGAPAWTNGGVTGSVPGNTELTPNNSLPIPDQLDASYHWIAQTERMLNLGEARVRHIDYENAPFGRTVRAPSPYRWWLGFLAWCEHVATGAPSSALVEKAALLADPLLLGIMVLGSAVLAAKWFGSLSASFISVGLVVLFPFVTGFWAGAPDDRGLAQALAMASVLLLSGAVAKAPDDEKARRRWFILAGVAGGLGLWVKVPVQLPVLWGIAAGALLVPLLAPRGAKPSSLLPWRAWASAGAATTILASLVEYTPSELWSWDLSFVHPLQGLAWLGAGELLVQTSAWLQDRTFSRSARNIVVLSLSLAAVVAVPAALLFRHGLDLFVLDGMDSHLTRLRGGIVARNLAAWMVIQGPSIWLWLTLAPLGVLIPAAWILKNRQITTPARAAVAITLGPVIVALCFACTRLAWWQTLDALLLVTLAAATGGISSQAITPKARLGWIGVIAALLVPGGIFALGWDRPTRSDALSRTEVQELVLRDLAGWIRQHSDPGTVTVLSPPSASTPLCYYGDFRGLGALSEENKDGMNAAVLIMSSRNLQEAKEMVSRRNVTHIVLLSWDKFFDDFVRAADSQVEGTLMDKLKFTTLPRWLRPLAYPLPSIPGFEDQSVTVLEVVDEQDDATNLGNIALYLAEIGDLDGARSAAGGLTRFSTNFGAWVARAQVAAATQDEAELAGDLKVLQARLALRVQPLISWDRRVDLAVVLARAKDTVLAKKELTLCIDAIDDHRIRSLSPKSVYRLLVLCRGLGVTMPPAENALALSLVPPNLRDRLQ